MTSWTYVQRVLRDNQGPRVKELRLKQLLASIKEQQERIGRDLTPDQAASTTSMVRDVMEACRRHGFGAGLACACIDILVGPHPDAFRIPEDAILAAMLLGATDGAATAGAGAARRGPRRAQQPQQQSPPADLTAHVVFFKLKLACMVAKDEARMGESWVAHADRMAVDALLTSPCGTSGHLLYAAAIFLGYRPWILDSESSGLGDHRSIVSAILRRSAAVLVAAGESAGAEAACWGAIYQGSLLAATLTEYWLPADDALDAMLEIPSSMPVIHADAAEKAGEKMREEDLDVLYIITCFLIVLRKAAAPSSDARTPRLLLAFRAHVSALILARPACFEEFRVSKRPEWTNDAPMRPTIAWIAQALTLELAAVLPPRVWQPLAVSTTVSIGKACLAKFGIGHVSGFIPNSVGPGCWDAVDRADALLGRTPEASPAHLCVAALGGMVQLLSGCRELPRLPRELVARLNQGALAADGDGALRTYVHEGTDGAYYELGLCGYPKCTNVGELVGLKRCGGGCLVRYCSDRCQQEDWKRPGGAGHRLACPLSQLLPPVESNATGAVRGRPYW